MTQDTETPTRPNVVLVLTDQHRYDHTGFGGNPVLQTPHLDALAARATSFSNAIVANPICMPNRATILTGRMPSAHGTRTNGIPLDWHAATVARQLRRAGYRTGLVGKAHFQNMGQVPGLFGDPTPPGPNEPHLPRVGTSSSWATATAPATSTCPTTTTASSTSSSRSATPTRSAATTYAGS